MNYGLIYGVLFKGIKKNPQEAVLLQEVSVQLPVNGSWNRLTKTSFSVGSVSSTVTIFKQLLN